MADDPCEELLGSLDKLLKEGTYSDLTISSTQDEFKVHKAIVCPRSTFFEKEGRTGIIHLPEDDPVAVRLLIQYLYRLDYPHHDETKTESPESSLHDAIPFEGDAEPDGGMVLSKKQKKSERKRLMGARPTEVPETPNLLVHSKLYALGVKYDIGGLKCLALKKFRKEVGHHWGSHDFTRAVEDIFMSTVEEDRGMRDLVLDTISSHPDLLDKPEMQDVVKSCDLSFNLMMSFRTRWL